MGSYFEMNKKEVILPVSANLMPPRWKKKKKLHGGGGGGWEDVNLESVCLKVSRGAGLAALGAEGRRQRRRLWLGWNARRQRTVPPRGFRKFTRRSKLSAGLQLAWTRPVNRLSHMRLPPPHSTRWARRSIPWGGAAPAAAPVWTCSHTAARGSVFTKPPRVAAGEHDRRTGEHRDGDTAEERQSPAGSGVAPRLYQPSRWESNTTGPE